MPSLAQHHASQVTKLLLIGESGAGKTGALAALAAVGYNLRIIDCDNGLDILTDVLDPKFFEHVHFVTCTDRYKTVGNQPRIDGIPQAFSKAMNMMTNWKDGDVNLGPLTSWGPQDVLVIDSLTMLCRHAMNHTLALAGRLGQQPHQSDWGVAQNIIEDMLAMLYSDSIGCNVIIMAHVGYYGQSDDKGNPIGPQRGLPMSLGKALSPKIGRYFNSVLLARTAGSGANVRRTIYTAPQGDIELKTSAPKSVAVSYPLETGLADYFKAVRS